MIETEQALAEVSTIASLPCVDGLFMGPADLSVARGRGAFGGTDADIADLVAIASAAREAGKHWGVPVANPTLRKAASTLRPNFVTVGDDCQHC